MIIVLRLCYKDWYAKKNLKENVFVELSLNHMCSFVSEKKILRWWWLKEKLTTEDDEAKDDIVQLTIAIYNYLCG